MMLQLQEVSVRHPASATPHVAALSDLTLSINTGEQIALIGPSGAGKTTLLHTLACAYRPAQGNYILFDRQPWALSERARHLLRRRLFLAPQTPPLPPRQRVVTAVLAGRLPSWSVWRALRNLIKPLQPEIAFDALARFHLQHKLYERVDRLSGGERQRCGLARLLLSDASLLLVDEPLSALDPTLAIQTLKSLQQEASERNATLICSLHQVELARAHFKRIIGLRDGKVVFDSEQVTDDMLAALYASDHRNARTAAHPVASPADTALSGKSVVADDPRCF
ncbi:ATP-binding cassette domain-containing protein [Undibacterium sp. Jales W-56]|uniref:phosphonate ABC transporter ATP-binding protein n=1 Tax=Undibacterium sp. Jales W-56 TaxID=2897325 RepID=UPI0021D200B4|nr:ATP-binding cassette domain-containing protein [Undibacterium sp. Jales W-56]MCU6435507.1 ATP-binding cassette domain-containing protein [Undibacterium sp. Jales W-56]